MKRKLLAILLIVCLVISIAPAALAAGYDDTDGHWAEGSIERWASYGIIEGVGDGEFSPDGTMTRAQAAAIFARLLKLDAKADISKYTDVDSDAWYAEYIAMCVAAGIMNGVGDNAMDPNGTLTREQMMVMLCRALGIQPEDTCDKTFADSDKISDWAEGYINALVNAGIVDGVGNNTMAPATDINRASMMALLDKSIAGYADEDGETITVDEDATGIILVVADNVKVEDAPAGTIVVTGADAHDTTVNGTEITNGTVHEVPEEEPVTPSVPPVIIPSHSHTWGSWISNENGTHTRSYTCGHSGSETKDCDGTDGVACSKCGYITGAQAKIGTTYFATLGKAFEAGGEVTLLKDITLTESLKIPEGKTVNLDLNGYKVIGGWNGNSTTNHIYAIHNSGTLTVNDSSEPSTGAVVSRGIYNYGEMTLENGTINAIDGNGGYAVQCLAGASFTMNGGTVATTLEDDNKVDKGGYDATPVRVEAGATFTMNGGEINNICDYTFAIDNHGTTTVKNGKISSVHTTVANYGTMTIEGGEFTCNGLEGITAHAVWAAEGTATINGGTFNGKDNYNGFNVDSSAGANVIITGGNFLPVHSGSLYGDGTITVSGGTFFDDPSARVADTHKAVKDGEVWTVVERLPGEVIDTEELQAALDAATDGTVIQLSEGVNYGTVYVGRPTKYNDTVMFCETHSFTTTDDAKFADHLADGQWHTTPKYTTALKNVTIVGAEGATVAGVLATSGHAYGGVHDYVLDKDVSGSAYCNTLNISNLKFSGVSFTGKIDINTSDATSVYDGVTFEGCTFTTGGTASSNGAAIRYYNENDNGNVKNLTVIDCDFTNCYQGIYVHHVNGVSVTTSTFNTTGHNAIALQGHDGAVNLKTIKISGNTFENIADRVIRFGDIGADSAVTISGNTITKSGDEDREVIKYTTKEDGASINLTGNTWDGCADAALIYNNGVWMQPVVMTANTSDFVAAMQKVPAGVAKITLVDAEGDIGIVIAPNGDSSTITVYSKEGLLYLNTLFDNWVACFTNGSGGEYSNYVPENGGKGVDYYYSGRWTIVLDADIDLNNDTIAPVAIKHPVSADTPTFNGNNHTIKNAKIVMDATAENAAGLFDASSVAFKNLKLDNIQVTGSNVDNSTAGVLSGSCNFPIDNITITNSSVTGGKYTGGVVGYGYTSITDCTLTNVTVKGGYKLGGIIGYICASGKNTGDVTDNTLTGCTVDGIGGGVFAGGKDKYIIGKVVGNYNCNGTCNNNTITGMTTSATANIGEIEAGKTVTQ